MSVALLISSVCIMTTVVAQTRILHQNRLIKDLLDDPNYDHRVRPVRNATASIDISVRINLYQIIEVNAPKQYIELYVWMTQTWRDEVLFWNLEQYGGLNWVTLPFTGIWLPDTYVYNSLKMTDSERFINVIATTNFTAGYAEMRFLYPAIYRLSCSMSTFYFPFDLQNCTLQVGSWTYDSSSLNFYHHGESVLMEAFVPSEEWDVLSFTYTRMIQKYLCCPHPYIWVNAHISIKRKPLHILSTLVLPTTIISVVAMAGFFLPSNTSGERTEKVTLGINTLLAMAILLLTLSHQMPASSESIPLIGWFYLSTILTISISTCLTSFLISIENQGRYGKPVPGCTKSKFFARLAEILMISLPKQKHIGRISDGNVVTFHFDECDWKFLTLVIDRLLLILSIVVITALNLVLLLIGNFASQM